MDRAFFASALSLVGHLLRVSLVIDDIHYKSNKSSSAPGAPRVECFAHPFPRTPFAISSVNLRDFFLSISDAGKKCKLRKHAKNVSPVTVCDFSAVFSGKRKATKIPFSQSGRRRRASSVSMAFRNVWEICISRVSLACFFFAPAANLYLRRILPRALFIWRFFVRSFNTMSAGFGGRGDDGNFIFLALFLLVRRDTFCQWTST